MKRAYSIISAVVVLGAGGMGTVALLPMSSAAAETASHNTLKTETFKIDKMTCAACPITVKKAVGKISGVSSVDVDFQSKTATVTFDPEQTKASAIASASTNAGYPAKIQAGGADR